MAIHKLDVGSPMELCAVPSYRSKLAPRSWFPTTHCRGASILICKLCCRQEPRYPDCKNRINDCVRFSRGWFSAQRPARCCLGEFLFAAWSAFSTCFVSRASRQARLSRFRRSSDYGSKAEFSFWLLFPSSLDFTSVDDSSRRQLAFSLRARCTIMCDGTEGGKVVRCRCDWRDVSLFGHREVVCVEYPTPP